MSQFHFDPATYLHEMRREVPAYGRLQEEVAAASEGTGVTRVLDLGTGTGETLAAVLARHPGARAVGVDKSAPMLEAARARLAGLPVELVVAELVDPLPPGPFDLVVSALAVHHLEGPDKAALFARVADVVRPGGRFVLADVVIPVDPADAVTPLTSDHDRPSTAADQLRWLAAAGFDAAGVWSECDLVVLRADRSLSRLPPAGA
ncbi:MAG TPA: class I SAM-dependent methyltransferase [Acidimicrobiales bacterium]|nr:class I SAM-dependent methyltransferase [Acidimicrobiales bacterium]